MESHFTENISQSTALSSPVTENDNILSLDSKVSQNGTQTESNSDLKSTAEPTTLQASCLPDEAGGSTFHIPTSTEVISSLVSSIADSFKSRHPSGTEPPNSNIPINPADDTFRSDERIGYQPPNLNMPVASSGDSASSCDQVGFEPTNFNTPVPSIADNSKSGEQVGSETPNFNRSFSSVADSSKSRKQIGSETANFNLSVSSVAGSLKSREQGRSATENINSSLLSVSDSCKKAASEPSHVIWIDDESDGDNQENEDSVGGFADASGLNYRAEFGGGDGAAARSVDYSELGEEAARRRQCSKVGSYAELSLSEDSDDNLPFTERRSNRGQHAVDNKAQKLPRTG